MKNRKIALAIIFLLVGCAEPRYEANFPKPPLFTPAPIWAKPLMCDEPQVLVLAKGNWFKLRNAALFKASRRCWFKDAEKPCVKQVTVVDGSEDLILCTKPNDVFLDEPR